MKIFFVMNVDCCIQGFILSRLLCLTPRASAHESWSKDTHRNKDVVFIAPFHAMAMIRMPDEN